MSSATEQRIAREGSHVAISVVVATHDRPERLQALLRSLEAQQFTGGAFEVVVVDDASGQATRAVLDRAADGPLNLRMITRSQQGGPAVARNQGWRAATAELVVFTDDDCEVAPDWLEEMVRAMRQSPGGPVQGRTESNPDEQDAQGPFARTLTITELGPHYQTCNMGYPRALLEQMGGFDESYPTPGGEDTDLAWRVLGNGIPIRFAPGALVYHAVNVYGPVGMLRFALRWSDTMQAFGRHAEYRRLAAHDRVFWKGSHAALARAVVGLTAARAGYRVGLVLTVPYLRHLAHQCRVNRVSPALAPYFLAYDTLEVFATLRGAARHGVLII